MKLNRDADVPSFLLCTDQCAGEVTYTTPEGGCLNLKSQLSKYIFLAAANARSAAFLLSGDIACSMAEDLEVLKPYLTC